MKLINKTLSVIIAGVILCSCSQADKIVFQDNPVDRDNYTPTTTKVNIEKTDDFSSVPLLTEAELQSAKDFVIEKIDANLADYTDKFPSANSTDYMYGATENNDWTESFWTGMVWLAYEHTNDTKYLDAAMNHCRLLAERLDENYNLSHHDIGFLYNLSCVKGYKLTGDETLKETALKAADKLLKRYNEKGKYIQAWGKYGAREEQRLIIDCMMNLELLYWAYNETGDSKYYDAAYEHAKTTAIVIMRNDGSTYHTYYINPKTGNPSHGVTAQGIADNSAWARGQAWGVYGFAISYDHTKDSLFMNEGSNITNYFLNHLPEDNVCYWDLSFMSGDEPRDTSAAAIAACGLLLASDIYDNEYKDTYKCAANAIMRSLIENYTTEGITSNAVLKEGVYSKPANLGVNEALIWGDYYYTEALFKLCNEASV